MKYTRDKVSVIPVLDRRRVKRTGLYPVKIEVIYNRAQKYYPIAVDMTVADWERMVAVWDDLDIDVCPVKKNFMKACREVDYVLDKGRFSFEALDERFRLTSEVKLDVALGIMRDEFMRDGRVNSAYMCKYALECIIRFSGGGVPFCEVTPDWLKRFELFILSEGKSLATVDIYMKAIKSTMRRAIRGGYISVSMYPFGQDRYVIPQGGSRTKSLTADQIELVRAYKGKKTLEKYRDLWLFSYMCGGMNFRDMLFLQYRNVNNDELCYTPSVVTVPNESKQIKIHITDEMRSIVRRWGNVNRGKPGMYLFKYAKGNENDTDKTILTRKVVCMCNRSLKKISEELDIPVFTTLSARKSLQDFPSSDGPQPVAGGGAKRRKINML